MVNHCSSARSTNCFLFRIKYKVKILVRSKWGFTIPWLAAIQAKKCQTLLNIACQRVNPELKSLKRCQFDYKSQGAYTSHMNPGTSHISCILEIMVCWCIFCNLESIWFGPIFRILLERRNKMALKENNRSLPSHLTPFLCGNLHNSHKCWCSFCKDAQFHLDQRDCLYMESSHHIEHMGGTLYKEEGSPIRREKFMAYYFEI